MKLRVLAFALAILAFFLFVGSPFQQAANAVVIVDDAIIAIVIAALAAFGITFTYTGGYFTLYDWMAQMIAESGASFTGCNIGVNSLSNLLLNNRFVRQIVAVSTYIASKYDFANNNTVTIYSSETGVLDEITHTIYQPGTYTSQSVYTEGTTLFSFYVNNQEGITFSQMFRFDGKYYRFDVSHSTDRSADVIVYSSDDMEQWTQIHSSTKANSNDLYKYMLFIEDGAIWLFMQTRSSGRASVARVVQLQEVSSGDDLIANINGMDIPSETEVADNYGILDLPIPWGESYQIILDSIPTLSDEDLLEGNTTLTLDSDTVVESQIDTDLTSQPYVSNDPSEYQTLGLQNVFPFCIPFDLYNFVSCLAADPVAPSFTWRFYVPGICDESIVIDLSEFDQAAQILRTMELLLFCVGLAFVTRKIIRG